MKKFEEGKKYRACDTNDYYTVSAVGDSAVAFISEGNHIFATFIKNAPDCEFVEYGTLKIWACDEVETAEVEEVNAENSVEVKTEKPNNQEVETAEVEEMSETEKYCLNLLEKGVALTVERLEEAASGDYENFADYLDDNLGVKILIDGRNLKYSSALITLATGGPCVWFDTASGRVFGDWGLGVKCEKSVNRKTWDAVDDYYQNYYETCRKL